MVVHRLGHPGPAHHRRPAPPHPGRRSSWPRPSTPASASWPVELGATTVVDPGELRRAVRRSHRHHGAGRRRHHPPDRRRRRGRRLRGPRGQPGRRPGRGPAQGPHHHGGHARSRARRPDRAVAARDHPGRRLRLRHRARWAGRHPPAHLRPGLRAGGRGRPRPAGQRHLPPGPTTPTPSPTPPAPAPAAASRSPSTSPQRRNAPDDDVSSPPARGSCWRSTGRPHRCCSTTASSFRLEKLPPGRSRIIYPSEPLEPLDDIEGAIHHALLNPEGDSLPLPDLLRRA